MLLSLCFVYTKTTNLKSLNYTNMRHKLFTLFLALIASTGLLFAESGTCGADGDNLTWELTDSVLTISGTGAMKDWNGQSSVPGYSYRSSIKSVVI